MTGISSSSRFVCEEIRWSKKKWMNSHTHSHTHTQHTHTHTTQHNTHTQKSSGSKSRRWGLSAKDWISVTAAQDLEERTKSAVFDQDASRSQPAAKQV